MPKAKKNIEIAYIKTEYHPLDELHEFQGNLKELYKDNAERLWNRIVKSDFSDPFKVWFDGEKLNILDGHQRRRVLVAKSKENTGIKIPDKFPCDYIRCKDKRQAKERVLEFISQYGHVTDEGLYEFIMENELDPESLRLDFDIPNLNMDDFMAGYFEDGDPGGGDEGEDQGGQGPDIIKEADFETLKPTDEEHEILKDRKFLVEFSGGKDSSLAAIWLNTFYPKNQKELLFIDSGVDYIGFNNHLHRFVSCLNNNLIILRTHINMFDAFIKKLKWPYPVNPYCQHNILCKTINDYVVEHNSNDIAVIRGGTLQQKNVHQHKPKNRFIKFKTKQIKDYIYFQPIYFLDSKITMSLLESTGCPIWDGYSYGLHRTACRICPGQRPSAYAAIKTNYPDVWDELLYLEKIIGPGCWTDPVNNKAQGSFPALAEKGMEKFLAGDYKRK